MMTQKSRKSQRSQRQQRRVEATFELHVATRSDAEIIFNAVKPELKDEVSAMKREYEIAMRGEPMRGEHLTLNIVSDDIVKLRAVLNTWLRLLNVASEMIDLLRSRDAGESVSGGA